MEYGSVEAAETPLASFQGSAAEAAPAPRSRSRAALVVAGMVVAGGAAVVGARAYSGSTTGAVQMAAVEPAVESLAAESEDTHTVVIGSWQREALRSVLKKVGYTQNIIFGHENSNREGQYFWDNAGMDAHSDVFNTTGQYPGMYGFSFQDIINGNKLTNHVLNAAKQNAIIEFFWEADNPVNGGGARDDTGYPCKALLPGGDGNANWVASMDKIVEALKEFKIGDTHIPIILRLFHECTESWYWWGDSKCDATNYKRAWNYTKWYLTDHSGLENILFVYAPAKVSETTWQAYTNWYPGDDQVDIIGFDRYAMAGTYKDYVKADCEVACAFAESVNKPCALAETGIADGIQNIANEQWFMTDVLDNLMNRTTEATDVCSNLAYMLTWSNEQPGRYWVPLPHQQTAPGFINFTHDTRTYFAGDVRFSDITKEFGYGFKTPGKSADLHGIEAVDGPRPITPTEPQHGVMGKISEDIIKDWGPFEYTDERLSALPQEEQEKVKATLMR